MNKNISMLVVCGALAMSAHAADQDVAVSSAKLKITNAKTDVLGRHNSKVRNTPKAYVSTEKAKSLMKTDVFPNEETMETRKGAFEYRVLSDGSGQRKYYLNDQEKTENQYLSLIKQIEDRDQPRRSYIDSKRNYVNALNNFKVKNYNLNVSRETDVCSGKETCVVHESSDEDIYYVNFSTIMKNSGLYKYGIQKNKKGKNIGISFTETMPFLTSEIVPENNFRIEGLCRATSQNNMEHGSKVSRTLNRIAPEATIYGLHKVCQYEMGGTFLSDGEAVVPFDGYEKEPKIYIGNHSYGSSSNHLNTNVGNYPLESKSIDDFIYYTRTIEFGSAGNNGLNEGLQISEIAQGVNVISVGAIHKTAQNKLTYHKTSSWRNPSFPKRSGVNYSGLSYVKPEIAYYADLLFPNDAYKVGPARHLPSYFSYTSSATPHLAASIAILLDRFPFYKWHPEVVKALLLTSSVKPIENAAAHDPDNVDYGIAMGVPDGKVMFENNRSRFWNGNNGDFFDQNGEIEIVEKNIKKGKRYRVAIAWLTRGSYVYEYGRLQQDLDLYLYKGDASNFVAHSGTLANPFEMIDYTADDDSNLRIVIRRDRNSGGRVLIGYNFVELPSEYQN